MKGEICDATVGAWVGFEQTWVATAQGISVTCRWPKVKAAQAAGWMMRVGIPGTVLEGGFSLIGDSGTLTRSGPFSRERDVMEVVSRFAGGTPSIASELPLVVSAEAEGTGWALWLEGEGAAGPTGEFTATFHLRPVSQREEAALRALSGEITAAEKSGALGEAIVKCRRVVDEFPGTPQAKAAEEKVTRLTAAAELALAEAERSLAKAREGKLESAIAAAIQRLRAFETAYAGSEFEARAHAIAEKGSVPVIGNAPAADEPTQLLQTAREALAREEFLTAELYARNAKRLSAGKPFEEEARKTIDEIRAAAVAARERDEWISTRLATARNFVKQGQSEKAVPVFEEVLAKYPKAKLCEGVDRELAEARR